MRQRFFVGRDGRLLAERGDGVELEGRARLAPGRPVDLVLPSTGGAEGTVVKAALVWTWYVVRVGPTGALYRGICRWTPGVSP